jgi:DNA-directed RNA polymerase II subunit RPB1
MGILSHKNMSIILYKMFGDIERVKFSIGNDNITKKISNVVVNTSELLKNGNIPIEFGLYDKRFGMVDYYKDCNTCLNNGVDCMGHFGHYEMNNYIIQPIYINEVKKWLSIICLECNHLNIADNKLLLKITSSNINKKCIHCGAKIKKIIKDKENLLFYQDSISIGNLLHPEKIKKIFDSILISDIKKFNCVNPSDYIIKNIIIPPLTIRPDIKTYFTSTTNFSYYDISNAYQVLIKKDKSIPHIDEIRNDLDVENLSILQKIYYIILRDKPKGKKITQITDNYIPLLKRIISKTGHIREKLLSKRSKKNCRTTIIANTKIKIFEIILPYNASKVLQVKEIFQKFNYDRLYSHYINGTHKFRGSSVLVKNVSNSECNVDSINNIYMPKYGDVLYRDVIDGDYAFFNRQPSLERSAVCVHKIIIDKNINSRYTAIAPLVCPMFNAFDKNVH